MTLTRIQASTWYFFAVAPYSNYSPPRLQLTVSAQPAAAAGSPLPPPTVVPPPPPPEVDPAGEQGGGWASPIPITATPFVTGPITESVSGRGRVGGRPGEQVERLEGSPRCVQSPLWLHHIKHP